MEYTTVELIPMFQHRYKIRANIYNTQDKVFENVVLFLDLGCYNTLIPKRLAVRSGHPLGFVREYRIGGMIVAAEAYSIENITINDVAIERVVAFAADYTGDFASDILIGTNVLNNWKMIIDRDAGQFQFRENPPKGLPNKNNIYQNYFDTLGNYVCVQESV